MLEQRMFDVQVYLHESKGPFTPAISSTIATAWAIATLYGANRNHNRHYKQGTQPISELFLFLDTK